MSNFSIVPGSCIMCGMVEMLRTLPGGYHYDGICERCDKVRFCQLNPRKPWVTWAAKIDAQSARVFEPVFAPRVLRRAS